MGAKVKAEILESILAGKMEDFMFTTLDTVRGVEIPTSIPDAVSVISNNVKQALMDVLAMQDHASPRAAVEQLKKPLARVFVTTLSAVRFIEYCLLCDDERMVDFVRPSDEEAEK